MVYWMGELTCVKPGPGATPHHVQQTRRKSSLPEAGEVASYGGIDVRLAHGLPGKPAEAWAPHHHFNKLSGGDVLI